MARALIIGVSGQDGAYLSKFLLNKGYEVFGTSRDASSTHFLNLSKLKVNHNVQKISMATNDFRSVLSVIKKVNPDEIYNLAGQTSVGLSFIQPVETMESNAFGTLHILEAIRLLDRPLRFFNAGSGECFGDTENIKATEQSRFFPRSPYAVAKAAAYDMVKNYQESYGLFACTGILFNHESPLRPNQFVTQKIINSAYRISKHLEEKLSLGNIEIYRDWGWAPDYVEAMWLMLQQKEPESFLISTGRTVSLKYFIEKAFAFYGLSWEDHLFIDNNLFRPFDIRYSNGNPQKAIDLLGWKATTDVESVVEKMCIAAKESFKNELLS
jgi:GDPmannose 4,6-dehydratase